MFWCDSFLCSEDLGWDRGHTHETRIATISAIIDTHINVDTNMNIVIIITIIIIIVISTFRGPGVGPGTYNYYQ